MFESGFQRYRIETKVAGDRVVEARCSLGDAKRTAAEMAKIYGRDVAYVVAEDGTTATVKAAS